MFIGHFGIGFGAKALAPRVSLGNLFLSAQFIDLLWSTFLLLGIERVRIAPGASAVTPLVFEHYPVFHSLLAVIGWAVLVGVLHFLLRRHGRGSVVMAALVISHWMLDAVVHQPDLPVFPDESLLVGLGAWTSLPLTLLIEVPLFLVGVALYVRCTAPADAIGKWGLRGLAGGLLLIYAGDMMSSRPPPGPEAIAWVGQLHWLFVLWAWCLEAPPRTGLKRRSCT